jgi:hypothetical protein
MSAQKEIKIDIYDFELKNYLQFPFIYDGKNYSEYKTESLELSSEDECGIIESVEEPMKVDKKDLFNIRSCDYIKGNLKRKISGEQVELNINDNLGELYFELEFENIKITSHDLIDFINKNGAKKVNLDSINKIDITENMKKIYEAQNIGNLLICVHKLLEDEHPKYSERVGNTYIKYLKPKISDKIILFGDLHGSLATVVRHLLRFRKMGIMDENGNFSPEYYFISLGDVVDRGVYGVEILTILYLLKIKNPTQVFLNRGNHEEMYMNSKNSIYNLQDGSNHTIYHFRDEVLSKINSDAEKIYELYNYIMSLQPSGIIIEKEKESETELSEINEKIFLAHGGLPHDLNKPNELPRQFIDGVNSRNSFILNDRYGNSIRWNDIYGKGPTIDNSSRSIEPNPLIKIIGTDLLFHAKELGFSMVIRGHQDSEYNTKIMYYNDKNWLSIKIYHDFSKEPNDYITEDLECRGAIFTIGLNKTGDIPRLKINGKERRGFFLIPVLTISTNTDTGRDLASDSFAILRFSDNTEGYTLNCTGGGNYNYKFNKYLQKNKRII